MKRAFCMVGVLAAAATLGACEVEDEAAGRPSAGVAPGAGAPGAPNATATGDGGTNTVGPSASDSGASPVGADAGSLTPPEAGPPAQPGRFVAVGYDGRRAMSLDGKT